MNHQCVESNHLKEASDQEANSASLLDGVTCDYNFNKLDTFYKWE